MLFSAWAWRMTSASQWKIFAYFLLLGIALMVILTILGAIVGVSMFAGGGAPIKVRLVKGANLAMEQVEAAVHGWRQHWNHYATIAHGIPSAIWHWRKQFSSNNHHCISIFVIGVTPCVAR